MPILPGLRLLLLEGIGVRDLSDVNGSENAEHEDEGGEYGGPAGERNERRGIWVAPVGDDLVPGVCQAVVVVGGHFDGFQIGS